MLSTAEDNFIVNIREKTALFHEGTRKTRTTCKISTSFEDLTFLNPRSHLKKFSFFLLNFSRSALFRMKTRFSLKYFVKTNVFETGISDHQKMKFTIMKLHFTRESPKTKYHRDYRNFTKYFSSKLSRQLDSTFCSLKENEDCEELKSVSQSFSKSA